MCDICPSSLLRARAGHKLGTESTTLADKLFCILSFSNLPYCKSASNSLQASRKTKHFRCTFSGSIEWLCLPHPIGRSSKRLPPHVSDLINPHLFITFQYKTTNL